MKTVLDEYDLIIFDCDGVLIDVNNLKVEAFGKSVESYSSEVIGSFVEYCKNSFGISRYIKFKEFLIDFAKEPFEEDKYNNLLENYSNICKLIYLEANITKGCKELLSILYKSNKKLYIASGSDESELRNVFHKRNLNNFFSGIYGSPKTKSECTDLILKNNIEGKVVFIGDAISDMKTAKKHNIDFIYMSKYSIQSKEQHDVCEKNSIMVIDTLDDLIEK